MTSGSSEKPGPHADSPQGRSAQQTFEHISSTANDTVKLLKSLERKKARSESGLFLAEGARLAEEALLNGWSPAYALAGVHALERPQTVDLLARMKKAGARVLTASEKVLVSVSRKDNPQTVITAFKQRVSNLSSFPPDETRRWVALYEVRDPGNLGTVVRTADAAGVDGVILIGQTCDPFSVEAVRASMGSLFAMPIASASFEDFNAWRKTVGARMVAASMRGALAHDKADYGQRSIVLMGNEQSGLPLEVEAHCDELVRIPMKGKADSLNLASAASVMIYEVWRGQSYAGART
ncbi:MAG: RNA methyltransferase [Hyphomonadaceae bacterium]|nr:RNA methyltransferase [Hyphomonadaceae bacterium]